MRINQRTYDIFTALSELPYPNGPFVMPDILKGCDNYIIKRILNRVHKHGESALPYARFFSILYTDADVRRFIEAFEEAAPDDYVQEADLDTSMPWTWESCPLSAEEEDTPESLARRYVSDNYNAIQQTFRNWKEEECAKIVQDIWGAYYNDREIPSGYKHQAGLFWKAFKAIDSIDEMGENTVEIDEVIDQLAAEIFDSQRAGWNHE